MRGRGYRSFAVVVVAAVAVATGCTMCPDPHDYSGPVPNGSAPQNDFRARSHGIIPTGATVRPWPAVVKAAPLKQPARPALVPVADEEPLVAEADRSEGDDADVIRLSATVSAEEESPPADAPASVDIDAVTAAVADSAGTAVLTTDAEADARQGSDRQETARQEDAGHRPPVAIEPGFRETPGWRPRR